MLSVGGGARPLGEEPWSTASRSAATTASCRARTACTDCVVTYLCDREPHDAVVIDVAEVRALRLLAGAGLVPELRHARRCLSRPVPGRRSTRECHGYVAAVPEPVDVDELLALGRSAGLSTRSASRRPTPFARARRAARGAQGGRAARRHGLHLPEPGAVDDARRARRRGPEPSWSGPAATRRRRAEPADSAAVEPDRGRVARYARDDHYAAAARRAVGGGRSPPAPHGWRAVVVADDNALVDREAAYRAGLGWYGKNANLLLPGQGSLVRARLGRHRRAAARPARARCADGCGAVPPLPRRLPDRRHRRRRAWSTPAAAWPGSCSGRARSRAELPRGAGRPDLRVRRLPGGLPARTASAGRAAAAAAGRGRRPSPWVDAARPARRADDATLLAPPRPLVPRRPRPALAAPQRPRGAGQRRPTPATPRWRRRCAALPAATPTRCCGPTPRGPRRGSGAPTCCAWSQTTPTPRSEPSSSATASCMTHLLVTNDFPPKVGGIQSYLWELWRRLPPDEFVVLTTPYPGAGRVRPGAAVPHRAGPAPVLLPTPRLRRRVERARRRGRAPSCVVLDPALPLGLLGPRLVAALRRPGPRRRGHRARPAAGRPRAAGRGAARRPARDRQQRLPGGRGRAGSPAGRCPAVTVYPGVDGERFRPLDAGRAARRPPALRPARRRARVVVGLSRLVPRKGFDVLIEAAAAPRAATGRICVVAIAGDGRDRGRLAAPGGPSRCARCASSAGSPTTTCPPLLGCADVFAMLCRNRWGGLEQEGFGIVFLEAAAAGVPQVAGASGGAAEAVVDGRDRPGRRQPDDPAAVADALAAPARRPGAPGPLRRRRPRARCLADFDHDRLAGAPAGGPGRPGMIAGMP